MFGYRIRIRSQMRMADDCVVSICECSFVLCIFLVVGLYIYIYILA